MGLDINTSLLTGQEYYSTGDSGDRSENFMGAEIGMFPPLKRKIVRQGNRKDGNGSTLIEVPTRVAKKAPTSPCGW